MILSCQTHNINGHDVKKITIGDAVLYHGDCLNILPALQSDSVDAVVCDPPYFRVKNEVWDRQWDSKTGFLDWLYSILVEFHRILKPNGSLYIFASPQMAARVEVLVGERFNVLNSITWVKSSSAEHNSGRWSAARKESLRCYFPQTERIIFAEHVGADNIAKGEAGYEAKCDQLKGFVFEPLRLYLRTEWERAGLKPEHANEACGTASMARHFFTKSQWCLPTEAHYKALQAYANRNGGEYLRREYEELRREYEELRRPFAVTKDVPYTDVWKFQTVPAYKGKHVCEKPLPLMKHIISASTKPGAIVLDPFAGSGATGVAALMEGRDFIGIEREAEYVEIARARIARAQAGEEQGRLEV